MIFKVQTGQNVVNFIVLLHLFCILFDMTASKRAAHECRLHRSMLEQKWKICDKESYVYFNRSNILVGLVT